MAVQLGSAFGKISIGFDRGGIDAAHSALESVRNKFNSVAADLAKTGAVLSLAITAPTLKIGKDALTAAADFQTSMSRIAGLTDTPRESIEKMGKAVIEMSKHFPQSAKELADA